jgi:hypothetical protein
VGEGARVNIQDVSSRRYTLIEQLCDEWVFLHEAHELYVTEYHDHAILFFRTASAELSRDSPPAVHIFQWHTMHTRRALLE